MLCKMDSGQRDKRGLIGLGNDTFLLGDDFRWKVEQNLYLLEVKTRRQGSGNRFTHPSINFDQPNHEIEVNRQRLGRQTCQRLNTHCSLTVESFEFSFLGDIHQ